MSTTADPEQSIARIPEVDPVLTGPVLVACDGAPVHETIFTASRKVAAAIGVSVEVVGVCTPTVEIAAGVELVPIPAELDETRRRSMLDDVRRAVSIAPAGDPAWPVEVRLGAPARTLAEQARDRGASLLVMGIGRHNPLDRLFGTEVTLSTLRESSTPILAVGATYQGPQHVVVGLDFSPCSIRAAQIALRLLEKEGRLTLVHVRPRFEHPSSEWQVWDAEYGRTLPPLFDSVRARLNVPDDVLLETVTLRGDPANSLLAYAQQAGADMVAVGTQRHSLLERIMVGSVASRLLRTARGCSVLAVPARAVVPQVHLGNAA
jgi:nucleotide-binding universal stress UspA family protein